MRCGTLKSIVTVGLTCTVFSIFIYLYIYLCTEAPLGFFDDHLFTDSKINCQKNEFLTFWLNQSSATDEYPSLT